MEVKNRPPASEAEALQYLPSLYGFCRDWATSGMTDRDRVGRRGQTVVILDQVFPTWASYFVRETFNRSLEGGGVGQIHLTVFGRLSTWLGAAMHLSLALKLARASGEQHILDSLTKGPPMTPPFIGGEQSFWLDGTYQGTNSADGTGLVLCHGIVQSGEMPMGEPFQRPDGHHPVWLSFEGNKLVMTRRQEDAALVLDSEDRCWFCQEKVLLDEEPHWLVGLRNLPGSVLLHAHCMFLPNRFLAE